MCVCVSVLKQGMMIGFGCLHVLHLMYNRIGKDLIGLFIPLWFFFFFLMDI